MFGQSFYMVTVILIILFVGEYFLPEEDITIDGIPLSFNGYVRTGRSSNYDGSTDDPYLYSEHVHKTLGPSRHFTILFTTFMFLNIVNELNCRSLHDEVNVVKGLWSNKLALSVMLCETAIQVIISEFGGFVFEIYPDGLTWYQWLICLTFAFGSYLFHLLLIAIPDRFFFRVFPSQ